MINYESYYITKGITDCAEGILMGKVALVINLLSSGTPSSMCIGTDVEWIDGANLGLFRYKYINDLDKDHFLDIFNENDKLFIPTA